MDACKFNVWWVGLEHGFIQDFSFGGGGGGGGGEKCAMSPLVGMGHASSGGF